jgi:serine/threonine protein kinase
MQPSNLLLNSECLLKLADFGLARSLADLQTDAGANAQLTDYVATRWYRAPEILLGSHKYTFGVDMWSCGCILGELLTGRPIFPGKSTMNQLDLIFVVTGVPTSEEAGRIGSPYCSQMLEMSGALCCGPSVAGATCGRLFVSRGPPALSQDASPEPKPAIVWAPRATVTHAACRAAW